jgi:hypothetical protein
MTAADVVFSLDSRLVVVSSPNTGDHKGKEGYEMWLYALEALQQVKLFEKVDIENFVGNAAAQEGDKASELDELGKSFHLSLGSRADDIDRHATDLLVITVLKCNLDARP